MKVKNHLDFALFDYKSAPSDFYQLGDIVINRENEIGVILQTYNSTEYRTDQFGNCDYGELYLATLDEIRQFRPELEKELILK